MTRAAFFDADFTLIYPGPTFQQHVALEGLFAVALSSSGQGHMKPQPSIFEAALRTAAPACRRPTP